VRLRLRRQRVAKALVILRLIVSALVLTILYFVLPLTSDRGSGLGVLILGLALVCALITVQAFAVLKSPYPVLRAAEALTISFLMFLMTFATTYYLMDERSRGSFSVPITRLDSLYFTVTTFATVGFGDITAVSQTARGVVTIQMIVDLVFIGVAVRVLVTAAQRGMRRARANGRRPSEPPRYAGSADDSPD
jgi:phosphoglycerol transferase MdoB-like AlkP superfamily enzyme